MWLPKSRHTLSISLDAGSFLRSSASLDASASRLSISGVIGVVMRGNLPLGQAVGRALQLPEDARAPRTGRAMHVPRQLVEIQLREQREGDRFLRLAIEEHFVEAHDLPRRQQFAGPLEENRMPRAATAREHLGYRLWQGPPIRVRNAGRREFH